MEKTGHSCHFIAPQGSQGRELVEALGASWYEIPSGKLARYPSVTWLVLIPNIIRGYLAAGRLLKKLNAQVVISSGSFVSPPVIWQAKRLGIRIIVIQLDISVGLANKVSIPFADRVFYSYASDSRQKDVIGPILRKPVVHKSAVEVPPGFEEGLPILMITGGGTGARQLNELVWELLPALTNRANIVHATGRGKEKSGLEYKRYLQVPFLNADNYYYWLERASFVIGRAGMGFFSDCIAYSKAAISIPMPNTHQEINAAYFTKHKAVITPEQKHGASPAWLLKQIDFLLENPSEKERLKSAIGSFAKTDTLDTLVKTIEELYEK